MCRKQDLLISPSLYTFFLYTLINEDWTKSDYVLSDRIPQVVLERLKDKCSSEVYLYRNEIYDKNYIKRFIECNKSYSSFCKWNRDRKYERVWGNDEIAASFPYRNQGIILVEDGPFNSKPKAFFEKRRWKVEALYLKFWFYGVFRRYISYGWDHSVKKIYHTSANKLPEGIANKGIEISIDKLWDNLPSAKKYEILDFYGLSNEFIEKLNSFDNVLVTQIVPLPEEEKIDIYRSLVKDVDESKLLIKTHYAEDTDYKKYFPKAQVISMPVPMQLFGLVGYQPQHVYTISSSAITPFVKKGVDVKFLGTEIDERLVSAYGIVRLEDVLGR